MSNMNFNCDVCGREVFGCTFVNGMKFCAKCYQETFGETDKDRKIADLEAKLAESEKQRQHLKDWLDNEILTSVDNESYYATINEYEEEVKKLKQQLAEKEKEIEELEEENKELNDYLETDKVTKREYYQKVNKIDKAKDREIKKLKDKIRELEDFTENTANLIDKLTEDSVFASTQLAIEELKKLKENAWQSATDISQLIDYTELAKIIDNQIKELKGEKK